MNRLEFLTRLRSSLEKGGLPAGDIDDALNYYEEVFLDAGFGRENETAESLGSPEDIAREILLDSGIHADGEPGYMMEEAVRPEGFEEKGKESGNGYTYGYGESYRNSSEGSNDSSSTLIKLLLLIITFPIWVPVAAVLFALSVASIAIIFALVVALGAAGVGLIAGGVGSLFAVPPVAVILIGSGMICLGVFGLLAKPAFSKLAPAAVDGVRKTVSKIREILNIGGE
ncbi:MAG: DUF1700 domain-containing protein [Ruminococcus sp.]|nr:DUF1700 domain-containing protein [Ruminococcus sp.]